jgi:DEAD/DEAH box helicase domain-containing protein
LYSGGVQAPFSKRQPAPWAREVGLEAVLEAWGRDPGVRDQLVLDETRSGRSASLSPIPDALHTSVRFALKLRGIDRLYAHQARAFDLATRGQDVVIATPTASGKSLAYHLPVLDRLSRSPGARALYLFPTKALARDQEAGLRSLMRDSGIEHGAVTYDGDTPQDARRAARERSGVVITNPDMLHSGLLPHHASWARFLSSLDYVIIDELHTYRGVFGSHLANVIRRLMRIARFHGARPVFLFSSATIRNPRAHAAAMLQREVASIEESGAPSGPRRVLIYNPPIVNAELGIRASYVKSAVKLAGDLVKADVPTLVFGQSRNQVEVMLKYLRDRLTGEGVPEEQIVAYRGGYLAQTRRAIETGLREGLIKCAVATNALELGIDIGSLDAVVCAGFPGSMAALWQRFGRGGRRLGQSLAVLVTSSSPLDQYIARTPRLVIESPIEEARIDPDNVEILVQHIKCGAFELPFASRDGFGALPEDAVDQALGFLADNQIVQPVPDRAGKTVYHWSADAYPAHHVSLRNAGWDNFAIIDVENTRTMAELDFRSAHTMLHEQAIYQHDGEQYQVERLDFENHKAFVRKVEPDYYTTAMTHVRVNVLHEERSEPLRFPSSAHGMVVGLGEVNVVEKVVGFKKIKFHTHENVGYGEVQLPEMQMPTTSVWLTVPSEAIAAVDAARAVVIDGLRGIAGAMHGVAAVGLMMDPHDLGEALVDANEAKGAFDPTIFLYDHVAGGVGLAPRLFEEREALMVRAHRLIASCPCADGCPGCVGPVAEQAAGQRASEASEDRGSTHSRKPPKAAPPEAGAGRKKAALALLAVLGLA